MKRGYYILFVLFILGSCETKAPSSSSVKEKSNGRELFLKNCVACHGADGKKMLAGAKDLSVSVLSENEMKTIIQQGKGNMAGYKSLLSENEIDSIIQFIKTLKK